MLMKEIATAMPWVYTGAPSTAKSGRKSQPGSDSVYVIRVDLKHIRPPIWRRFTTVGSVSLSQLHEVIQCVMDWTGSHLYCFEFGDLYFGDPDSEIGLEDAREITLANVAPIAPMSFTYVYDFGDDWQHKVSVEQILPLGIDDIVPQVLKGKRNRPPEDVGGPWGYQDFLAALVNPGLAEYEEMMDWVSDWDPERFNREFCQESLYALAARQGWARPI